MARDGYGTVQSGGMSSNRLLAALPAREREILESHATFVELKRRDLLYDAEKTITSVYFIVDGIASILSVMNDGTAVETATIGREGMVGMPIFHGVSVTAELAMIQVPGSAYRLPWCCSPWPRRAPAAIASTPLRSAAAVGCSRSPTASIATRSISRTISSRKCWAFAARA
jgi:CRP-like cAMP-binding protein